MSRLVLMRGAPASVSKSAFVIFFCSCLFIKLEVCSATSNQTQNLELLLAP